MHYLLCWNRIAFIKQHYTFLCSSMHLVSKLFINLTLCSMCQRRLIVILRKTKKKTKLKILSLKKRVVLRRVLCYLTYMSTHGKIIRTLYQAKNIDRFSFEILTDILPSVWYTLTKTLIRFATPEFS